MIISAGSVHEIMLKMRAVALSWVGDDQEMADHIVAKALKRAIDEVPGPDRVDIEGWLMDLLVEARGTLNTQAAHSPAAPSGYAAEGKISGNN